MVKCKEHTGRGTIFGNHYCAKCTEQIKAMQPKVDMHVTSRDCFVMFKSNATGWKNIDSDSKMVIFTAGD
jgi:hypothetical protein